MRIDRFSKPFAGFKNIHYLRRIKKNEIKIGKNHFRSGRSVADVRRDYPSFVGEVSAEAKMTDAQTGQLLAAGVDRRVGGNEIEASVDNWDDVNKIIEIWSKLIRFRLCKLRGREDCLNPL